MMVTLGIYVRRWQRTIRRWLGNPKVHALAQAAGYILCGMLLSAASLGHFAQPFTLGLLLAMSGWPAVLTAGGGMLGYLLFWGSGGAQGILWLCAGLPAALILGERARAMPLLKPCIAGAIVAAMGLAMQIWLESAVPVWMYLLRVAGAMLSALLFTCALERQDPVLRWLVAGVVVLALAQVIPIPYLGFGYIAAGILAASGTFPEAALAGLALDLAQITPTPMTAVLCLAYLIRLIPRLNKWVLGLTAAAVYLPVMALCNAWDLQPLPGLILGGLISVYLPGKADLSHRRGDTGFAQVRLEMVSSVLAQTRELLMEVEEFPIDEETIILRCAERACSGCPCRKTCKEEPGKLPISLLHRPLGNGQDLPVHCRKTGRLLQELRRGQEQLRAIRADRDRREEYRCAVAQQYKFLSGYLQDLSDSLSQRRNPLQQHFQPELAVCSASRESANGDRCLWFAGVECKYYILLCDGMGTGEEAARAGKRTGDILRKLLAAGYPPEYALRTVNSLCALRGQAGAVTMDLAELQLDTGKATLYKWGAAPSYLISRGETVKIGTAAPPPGLSVSDGRETVQRLSLRRGEILVLLSDGAGGEDSLRRAMDTAVQSPGEMAAGILEYSRTDGADDATVAVVRLNTHPVST